MEIKKCTNCQKEKPSNEFYTHNRDGFRSHCKVCSREDRQAAIQSGYQARYNRQYFKTPKYKEWFSEYIKRPAIRNKYRARFFIHNRLNAGKLNREPCVVCNTEPAEAHHLDYNQPLMIMWLCTNCHKSIHKLLPVRSEL